MISAPRTSSTPRQPSPAPGSSLVWLGSVGLVALAVWFWFTSPWQDIRLNTLAIGICVLGVVPMLRWLHRRDPSYPLPELLQLTMVPFYAIPIFSEHQAIMGYTEAVLTKAVLLVVVFQACALLGSFFSSHTFHRPDERSLWRMEFVSEGNLRFTTYTMMSTSVWLLVSTFTDIVPREYYGVFRAVFFGVGTLSNFIQARMWGAGQLERSQKVFFMVNLVVQIILQSLSLLLISGIITTLLALVGYFSSARRVPLVLCLAALAVFGVLHNGKHQMRKLYWEQGAKPVQLLTIPQYLAEWFGHGLDVTFGDTEESAPGTPSSANIFQRASLIQIVSYAVDTVPMPTPYLEGATYTLIPPQIFPRFLWPDKPSPNDSVKILSVRLGILSEDQAETTSIGYGLIAESYVNFGFISTGLLGFLLGWLLRRAALVTAECGTLSAGGIFRILCLAWCLNTETTLAVWLSSFYQAFVAIFVPLFFLQSLFR
ncbi:MAG: hypothetical protein ACOZE5_07795 [Verrucomicrobiota bacterium]